ncbi:SURF1 family protein [Aureimonas sp. AU12]|uniref:SURF1 family protein n=1 Tax=Aureimonas sp. AU12 TaxID=1638161 RepID=UPI00078094D3|nr:SURF1 family protein [Aureimonas sp. AU12]
MGPQSVDLAGPTSRGRFLFVVAICLVGIAILSLLGVWQVERLTWKNEIVARIDARIHAAPRPIGEIEAAAAGGEDIDYVPAAATGVFDHAGERYFLSTFDGQAGWNVYTPMRIDGEDRLIFVNRGFVPYDRKDPATRAVGNPEGVVAVTGLARAAATEKPNSFMPDNDPAKNTFFWRDVTDMAAGLALPAGTSVLPFFLDAGPGAAPGGYPVGGVTVVDVPNNHLQYAITWFGLAAVLVVMLVLFLIKRVREPRPPSAIGPAG